MPFLALRGLSHAFLSPYLFAARSDSLKGLCISTLLAKVEASDSAQVCLNCGNPKCTRTGTKGLDGVTLLSTDDKAKILVHCLLVASCEADKKRCVNWIASEFDEIAPTHAFTQNVILTNPQLMVQIVQAKSALAAAKKKAPPPPQGSSDEEDNDDEDELPVF